jgi:hypothetical protein
VKQAYLTLWQETKCGYVCSTVSLNTFHRRLDTNSAEVSSVDALQLGIDFVSLYEDPGNLIRRKLRETVISKQLLQELPQNNGACTEKSNIIRNKP